MQKEKCKTQKRNLVELLSLPSRVSYLPVFFFLFPFSFFLFPSSSDNWTQFRGNLQLTGVSQSIPPEKLKVLWTYEAGDAIESSAAIADGVVYLASQKGELVALSV